MAGIGVDGLQEAIAALASGSNIESIIHANALIYANKAADYARQIVPIVTGYLQSSIYVEDLGDDVAVGAYADYAGFVENGTRKMQARPFLGPSLIEAFTEFQNDFSSWGGDAFE